MMSQKNSAKTLLQLPVNRVSMGAQTFSDHRLRLSSPPPQGCRCQGCHQKVAWHRHPQHQHRPDVRISWRNSGRLEKDIDEAIKLGVEHISAYSLMYEEGTTLYRMLERERLRKSMRKPADRCMSYSSPNSPLPVTSITKSATLPSHGYRSRHNSSYWHEVPYIGIGAAAHSYRRETKRGEENKIEATRSWNVDNIREYIASIQKGELPSGNRIPGSSTTDTMTLSPPHYGQAMVLI